MAFFPPFLSLLKEMGPSETKKKNPLAPERETPPRRRQKEKEKEKEKEKKKALSRGLSLFHFFTRSARIAFSTASTITPTSAKMAAHMSAAPTATSTRQANFTASANTMF